MGAEIKNRDYFEKQSRDELIDSCLRTQEDYAELKKEYETKIADMTAKYVNEYRSKYEEVKEKDDIVERCVYLEEELIKQKEAIADEVVKLAKDQNMVESYALITVKRFENSVCWRITKPIRVIGEIMIRTATRWKNSNNKFVSKIGTSYDRFLDNLMQGNMKEE